LLFRGKSPVSTWAGGRSPNVLDRVVGQSYAPFLDGDVEHVTKQGKVEPNGVGGPWSGVWLASGVCALQARETVITVLGDDFRAERGEGVFSQVLDQWLGVAGLTCGRGGALSW